MNTLRPDEVAAEEQIRRAKKLKSNIGNATSVALGLGGAAIGAGLSSKIMPFLNDLIPSDLAIKGISKFSPKIGEMLKKGREMGLDVKEGLNFVKENMISKPEEKTQDNRNIIEQYSPELHQFITKEIQGGRSSLEAGSLAQLQKPFKSIIDKLTKDHKSPFSSILQTVYGQLQQSQPQQQNQQSEQKISPNMQKIMELLQQRNKR